VKKRKGILEQLTSLHINTMWDMKGGPLKSPLGIGLSRAGNTLHNSLSHSHFVLSFMFDDNSFALRDLTVQSVPLPHTGQGGPTGLGQNMFLF